MKLHLYTLLACIVPLISYAQDFSPYYYDAGSAPSNDLFVDPVAGSDANSGHNRASALRTVQEAWRRIPSNRPLTTGYTIQLLPGVYGDDADELPNYWELKRGTQSAPIVLQAADGQGTVRFTLDINMANVSYFYLLNIEIRRDGDTFHCEKCDHILLRGNKLIGAPNGRNNGSVAHETVKFNQSQYVYIENNVIQGADDNGIDFVAVQFGHIVGNRINDTQGWCTYVKGGSAYIRIEANEFFNCFEGGITAGQGTGLEFMTAPWFHYEAYDIKIINNIIHDIDGAALGVNGGLNILIAHNTAYRIGSRSHLLEIVFGSRSCDGDGTLCRELLQQGAWGTTRTGGDDAQPIGNRRVKIFNNIFYNPPGFQSGYQHVAIYGPQTPTNRDIPSPQRSDEELEIKGNIFWNGTTAMPLGVEDDSQGCRPSNPTCNESQLRQDNWINSVEPVFMNPTGDDFRPTGLSPVYALQPATLSSFEARLPEESTPEGNLSNLFTRDRSGTEFSSLLIGAYASSTSTLPPPNQTNPPPSNTQPPADAAPVISNLKAKLSGRAHRYSLKVSFNALDDHGISRVRGTVKIKRQRKSALSLRRRASGEYRGKRSFTSRYRGSIEIVAIDTAGNRTKSTARF